MKLVTLLLILFGYTAYSNGFTIAPDKTTTFNQNNKVGQNELNFMSKAPLEDIYGNVNNNSIESSFSFNPNSFNSLAGFVSFSVDAMETGIDKRDEHLKSSDWLNSEKHPKIRFEAKSFSDVKLVDDGSSKQTVEAMVSGTYSMHGESKSMSIPVEITYMPESEKTKKRATGDLIFIKGEFQVKLSDYNVKGAKGLIGKKVGESIHVEFNLYYNSK